MSLEIMSPEFADIMVKINAHFDAQRPPPSQLDPRYQIPPKEQIESFVLKYYTCLAGFQSDWIERLNPTLQDHDYSFSGPSVYDPQYHGKTGCPITNAPFASDALALFGAARCYQVGCGKTLELHCKDALYICRYIQDAPRERKRERERERSRELALNARIVTLTSLDTIRERERERVCARNARIVTLTSAVNTLEESLRTIDPLSDLFYATRNKHTQLVQYCVEKYPDEFVKFHAVK
jgi:hypothetical protein